MAFNITGIMQNVMRATSGLKESSAPKAETNIEPKPSEAIAPATNEQNPTQPQSEINPIEKSVNAARKALDSQKQSVKQKKSKQNLMEHYFVIDGKRVSDSEMFSK